jgi:hypothetical protein
MKDGGLNESLHDDRMGTAVAEYYQNQDRGVPAVRQQILAKYPELAEDLRSFFESIDALTEIATPSVQPRLPY